GYSNDAHPNYQDLWPGIISASTSRCFCRHQSPRAHSFSASDAIGTVICRYRILREGERGPDRLDVRFGERRFAWGVPEKEFEVILN
ncbi:MAG: hypothetical protein WA733_12070, partial [Methylocystis sp.]